MSAKWCEGSPTNEYLGQGGHWYDPTGTDAPKPVAACICTPVPKPTEPAYDPEGPENHEYDDSDYLTPGLQPTEREQG